MANKVVPNDKIPETFSDITVSDVGAVTENELQLKKDSKDELCFDIAGLMGESGADFGDGFEIDTPPGDNA